MKSVQELQAELAELEGQEPEADAAEQEPVPDALAERRAHFTSYQQRLAAGLSRGERGFHVIDGNKDEVSTVSDKLVVMQIIRLMLDDDGNDGILYAATGWNSKSKQSLADRMGNHRVNQACNPRWRLGMQSPEHQRAYAKRQADILKMAYIEPKPVPKLDAKTLVHMSSQQFAEFVVNFYRKVTEWDLKQYVYDNLKTPAKEFFNGFIALQKEADAAEEELFKGAMAAHILATDPERGEEDAQEFLQLLRCMAEMEHREAERIANRQELVKTA